MKCCPRLSAYTVKVFVFNIHIYTCMCLSVFAIAKPGNPMWLLGHSFLTGCSTLTSYISTHPVRQKARLCCTNATPDRLQTSDSHLLTLCYDVNFWMQTQISTIDADADSTLTSASEPVAILPLSSKNLKNCCPSPSNRSLSVVAQHQIQLVLPTSLWIYYTYTALSLIPNMIWFLLQLYISSFACLRSTKQLRKWNLSAKYYTKN